jgi:hypothetical protein
MGRNMKKILPPLKITAAVLETFQQHYSGLESQITGDEVIHEPPNRSRAAGYLI